MKRVAAYLLLLCCSVCCFAQKKKKTPDFIRGGRDADTAQGKEDYFETDFFRYEDWTYKKNIRTVQLSREDWAFATPIIKLGTEQKLKLGFDDLDGDVKTYSFSVIHCDADWTPSSLINSDYITGFYDDRITDYKASFNTVQKYTHWNLAFPTDNMKLTRSGNYVLKVYTNYNPDSVVLTRRFMIYEDDVRIMPRVHGADNLDWKWYRQEVDFDLDVSGMDIINPFSALKVTITQNDRWDNAVTKLKPLFVKDKLLSYDYDEDNVFNGGSEFRWFDTRSVHYINSSVYKFETDSARLAHAILYSDTKRNFKRYSFQNDINGRFRIKVNEGSDYERDADYVYVNFTLPADQPFGEGQLFVFGQLTDWQFRNEFKMVYDSKKSAYTCTAFLKQGYYNYEYVLVKDRTGAGDETEVEGNHYETENDYSIYVYYKAVGSTYDQLIGMKKFNTSKGY